MKRIFLTAAYGCGCLVRDAGARGRTGGNGLHDSGFHETVRIAADRGDRYPRRSQNSGGICRYRPRSDFSPEFRQRHADVVANDSVGGRHFGCRQRHRRYGVPSARFGCFAHQCHNQRRADERCREPLGLLVRYARHGFFGRNDPGTARCRNLDQRYGSLRRFGEYDHRPDVERISGEASLSYGSYNTNNSRCRSVRDSWAAIGPSMPGFRISPRTVMSIGPSPTWSPTCCRSGTTMGVRP